MTERDLILAVPFNDVLGYTCPICGLYGKGKGTAQGTRYCSKCGQRLKFYNVKNGDWNILEKDVLKIPNVFDTDIVTYFKVATGNGTSRKEISGVYLDRFKAYGDKHAQIEGQMSIFDYGKGAEDGRV